MMPATITSAHITTVRPDRTIVLPEEMAVGTTVAVVVLPAASEQDDAARRARFETTLSAIGAASNVEGAPSISDEQLDTLIKRASRNSTAPNSSTLPRP